MIEARVTSPRGGWFHHDEFSVAHLIAAKRNQRVAVCIPARNEEATVGAVVGSAAILQRASVVDEVIVVDDASEDGTARVAQGAGARVVRRRRQGGKGAALRRAVASSPDADIFVFLDADVVNVSPRFVVGLLGPLLLWPEFVLVKAAYRRSLHGRRGEGGRVTELMARPLLDRWFPELADVGQPLAGECAIRRCVTDTVGFDGGYAIEIGLLIDVAAAFGREAIAEVDLDDRLHRNRSLSALRWQAAEILDAVLRRVDLGGGGVEDDR